MSCPLVIPIDLTISVPDVNDVLVDFDRIQIFRSTNGEGGAYQEITATHTRPQLAANVVAYDYTDALGSSSYWYKYRYYNSVTFAFDSFSTAQPGQEDPALSIVSIDDLKTNYLFGVDLTRDDGMPYPDSVFAHYIRTAVSWMEHKLDIPIRPLDIEEERQDYMREDYGKYLWTEVDRFPVIHVESVRMVLPGEQTVQDFKPEWIHVARESGQIQIVPGPGTAGTILLGAAGAWVPFIYGSNRYIPDLFRIKYRAGFGRPAPGMAGINDPQLDVVPYMLKDVIGKFASCGPLNIAGDLIAGAGVASQSLGIDGLSQSISTTSSATNAGYGARIIQYTKDLKDMVPTLIRYYKGLRMRAG